MSFAHVSRCWRAKMGATRKLTLLYFAECAGKDGTAFPTNRHVAKRTGLSVSAVAKARRWLVEWGYLEVVEDRIGRSQLVRVYPEGDAGTIPDNVVALKPGFGGP